MVDDSGVVDLRLIRTQKSEPVILVEPRQARDAGDGTLLWEGGIYQVDTTNGADATRYDARIIEENIRVAHGWCSNMDKPDKKLLKHLRKALKRAVKL